MFTSKFQSLRGAGDVFNSVFLLSAVWNLRSDFDFLHTHIHTHARTHARTTHHAPRTHAPTHARTHAHTRTRGKTGTLTVQIEWPELAEAVVIFLSSVGIRTFPTMQAASCISTSGNYVHSMAHDLWLR